MAERIEHLITLARGWHAEHQRHGRGIEAMACVIRIRALQDALEIVRKG